MAARALAERIVSTVHLRSAARRPVAVLSGSAQPPIVTVSIGFASVGPELPGHLRAEAMFSAADRALYEAKAKGPSSVHSAAGEVRGVVRAIRGQLPSAPIALGRRRTS
jgi:GGDEF domain-containing protein